jgi:hypothetical protein
LAIPTFFFLLFLTVLTSPAYADGIDFPLFLVWGTGILSVILAFNILGEALVLRLMLSVPFWTASGFFLRANLWSLVGGIPTKILTGTMFVSWKPKELSDFYHQYPYIAVVCILTYFVVTVLIEIGVGIWWYRKMNRAFGQRSLCFVILVANVLTYSVLGPLYYWATRPMWNEVDDITPDTSWARSVDERIFYVDTDTHELMAIHADGSGRETWVPLPMREYLLSGDLNFCVFLGREGDLHYYDRSTDQHVSLGPAGEKPVLRRVAISPSGKRVAVWRSPTTDSTLCVYDMTTGATHTQTMDKDEYATWWCLAWSGEEDRMYMKTKGIHEIILAGNVFQIRPVSATESLSPCFGRFSIFTSGFENNERAYNPSDTCGEQSLSTDYGIGSNIFLWKKDPNSQNRTQVSELWFAINPGIIHMASWQFLSGSFLPSCEEVVFEDKNSIYLWDTTQRMIGKVTTGERHMVLTGAYSKERLFNKDRF